MECAFMLALLCLLQSSGKGTKGLYICHICYMNKWVDEYMNKQVTILYFRTVVSHWPVTWSVSKGRGS
jgi:hypothetical protein